jgi:hypothetical protein
MRHWAINVFELTDNLTAIVDSVGVSRKGPHSDSCINAPGEKKAVAWAAVDPIKTHYIAGVVDSIRRGAGNAGGREVDGCESTAAPHKPVRALQGMIRIGKIVAARNLAGTINVAALRSGSRIGIVDREKSVADI